MHRAFSAITKDGRLKTILNRELVINKKNFQVLRIKRNRMNHLGYFTDFYFLEDTKEIIEYPRYTLVRSPNQPFFYYGNYLLLDYAPRNSDKERLEVIFKKHFINKGIKHLTFCWTGDNKEGIQSFINSGYELEELSVLVLKKEDAINLDEKNNEISIREFKSITDWQNRIDLEYTERPKGFEEKEYKKFIEGKSITYQNLNKKGDGNFYGAYIDNELVAAAGLFHKGNIGRFQSVRTKKAFRKKKICRTLLYHICKIGFKKLDKLVIIAEKGYHALDIYKGLGFKEIDSQTSLCWKRIEEKGKTS